MLLIDVNGRLVINLNDSSDYVRRQLLSASTFLESEPRLLEALVDDRDCYVRATARAITKANK